MNLNGENLGKYGLEGTKGILAEFSAQGFKINTWLGVIQSALGNSNSSSRKTKIVSLIHALIPLAKAKSAFNTKSKSQLYYPKQQEHPKAELAILGERSQERFSKDFLKIEEDLAKIIC